MSTSGNNYSTFREFYDLKYPMACQYTRKFLRDPRDIVQDVFLTILQRWDTMNRTNPRQLDSYLFISLRNRCIDEWRRARKMGIKIVELSDLMDPEDDSANEKAEIRAELLTRLAPYIDRLKKKSRKVIKAVYFEEIEIGDYARENNMPRQSAINSKNRGLARLRNMLEEDRLLILLIIMSLLEGPWKN